MLPRDVGSIPPDLFAAGAVQYYDYVRFDFDTPKFLTNYPFGMTEDIGDGSGTQDWEGGTLMPVGPISQGAKNPLTVDEVQVVNADGWWKTFVLTAVGGVYNYGVQIFRGWFDDSLAFVGAHELFTGYTDSISALYMARIALKSQTAAHSTQFPAERVTHDEFPTLVDAGAVFQLGSTTSKQPSMGAGRLFYTPAPPVVPDTPFDYTNTGANRPPPVDPIPPSQVTSVPLKPADSGSISTEPVRNTL